MNDIGIKIELYHNLFQGSLMLALFFFGMAVILFFMLDIRATLGYLTGSYAKKRIRELEEATAASGRLMKKQRTNMQYSVQEVKHENASTAVLKSEASVRGKFVIVRELMLIHTEETI